MVVTKDAQAWRDHPSLRLFHNKLWLADTLGYKCGPVGVPIPEDGKYIVRPTYNVVGMSAGAKVGYFKKDDLHVGPLGHFWCEFIEGNQYSVDYDWDSQTSQWVQGATYLGTKLESNLTRFESWKKANRKIDPPSICSMFPKAGVFKINAEFIEGSWMFEVHMRSARWRSKSNPGPVDPDELIPIWSNTPKEVVEELQQKGYIMIDDFWDALGFIDIPRIGFMVK